MIRRVGVSVLGSILVVLGFAMLFLPGPGLLTIVAGLAVLGSEFERPRTWMARLRERTGARPDERSL